MNKINIAIKKNFLLSNFKLSKKRTIDKINPTFGKS